MLPNCKKPCKDCPFRKDSTKGWLGESRITEILSQGSFTCHKTKGKSRLQCAGHMLLLGDDNEFVLMAKRLKMETGLSGRELVFDTKQECIDHHKL